MTVKPPALPPVGFGVKVQKVAGKPGSFAINGKEYHVDSLELTDFGGSTYKQCSGDQRKMQDVAQIIQDTANQMVADGKLDPRNLPDELTLEFSRKSFKSEPRSHWFKLIHLIPFAGQIAYAYHKDKKINNEHSFDNKTDFALTKLVLGSGKDREEIEIDDAHQDYRGFGQALTDQLSSGVSFAPRKQQKTTDQHIQGFMLPTVVDGDCAIDAVRQALVQRNSFAFGNVTNDQIRRGFAKEIRNNPLFQQQLAAGGHFESVIHALREAADRDRQGVANRPNFAAVDNLLRAQQALTPEEQRQIVQFYADYIEQPGVHMDLPFFLFVLTEGGQEFVILVRSEDGSQNPGYRVQAASPGATADNAVFVIHDGHNHYLAVDHSAASSKRRQAIMANYQGQLPNAQLRAFVAALSPAQLANQQQSRRAANHLFGIIQNLRIANPNSYNSFQQAILADQAFRFPPVIPAGLEDETIACAIVSHVAQAQHVIESTRF